MNRRNPRTYTYRISMDDSSAMMRIRRFQRSHDHYMISKLHRTKIPNYTSSRHLGFIFYESTERYSYEVNDMVGGAIPGLGEYRYSLEWEAMPHDSLLEMKPHHKGGSKIKGEQYVGTSDPRLSHYAPIDTAVPWTPNEIKAMYDGEEVPNVEDYTRDTAPMIPAQGAINRLNGMLEMAKRDGIEEMNKRLQEYEESCDHDHAIEDSVKYGDVGWCEDCGKTWVDHDVFEAEATVVGSA